MLNKRDRQPIGLLDVTLALLIVLVVAALFIGSAHGATSAPKRGDNSLGAVIEYSNPLVYNLGIIKDAKIVRKGDHIGTNLMFQPFGTFTLYTEQVLLCGPPTDDLIDAAKGPIVLAYTRQAHESVDGVGCHELKGAFSIGAQ